MSLLAIRPDARHPFPVMRTGHRRHRAAEGAGSAAGPPASCAASLSVERAVEELRGGPSAAMHRAHAHRLMAILARERGRSGVGCELAVEA
jgi:hypothetical protein